MVPIKQIANAVTLSRIPAAAAMLLTVPFSAAFWVMYIYCGIADTADGIIARKLNQQSATGAKLDSAADLVFAAAIAAFAVINLDIPVWMWLCAISVASLRLVCYGVGCYKFHTFAALHTYLNKLTGALIFASPLLYLLCGLTATGIILCVTALASALEETIIIITLKTLNRNCKGIFIK